MTLAIDFDGTLVEHAYPEIGKEIPFAVQTLKQLAQEGHILILWTVRQGQLLDDAVEWCRNKGIEFYAVNKNFPEEEIDETGVAHKVTADYYIDDRNIGGLPDWGTIYQLIKRRQSFTEYLYEQLTEDEPKKKKWWKF